MPYANVPEAKSQNPGPPNLRDSTGPKRCAVCKMYDDGMCWGYGNWAVEPDQVCDSFAPDAALYPDVPDAKSAAPGGAHMETVTSLIPNTVEWRHERAKQLSDSQKRRSDTRHVQAPLELRQEAEGVRTLRSYASLFDASYMIGSAGYRYEESVKQGAFKRSLGSKPDVVFRYDHSGPPLARTTSGSLRLGEDKHGLWYEADLNVADPDVRALLPKIERRDLSESSFAFRCIKDAWNDDYTTRSLEECELDRGDVSVVTFGASRATGAHLVLRSEEALQQLRDIGFEAFLEAWTEWRNHTLIPLEDRAGKVLSSASMVTLQRVLELVSTADDAVDEGQALLADLMGIPNPDGDMLTSGGQLGHVRGEQRTATNGDHLRTPPHLLDSTLVDLGHLHRHVERMAEADVQANAESMAFNQDHAMRHVTSAQDHVFRLGEHLEQYASDPQTFRTEREKLTSMRADDAVAAEPETETETETETVETDDGRTEANDAFWKRMREMAREGGWFYQDSEALRGEQRADPTAVDPDVMQALVIAGCAIHDAMDAQKSDPDMGEDPLDGEVWSHLEDAKNSIKEAILDQAKDGIADLVEDDDQTEGGLMDRSEHDEELYWETEEFRATFSAGDRDSLTSKGQAMPDGSYPIRNVSDLKNAIQAFGRAKNPSAVKAWIKRRASALGATNVLPESWRAIADLADNDSDDLVFDLARAGFGRS